MKIIIISLVTIFTFGTSVAFGQFRYHYPYGRQDPYQRLQQNMERNQDQYHGRKSNRDSRLQLNLNYSLTQPMGNLRDYVDKTSFTGWNASLLYQVNPKFAAGLGVGFNDYYQKFPRQVYQDKTTDISAVQSHSLQLIPIQATAVFTPNGKNTGIQPYIGLGAGIADVNYEKYWGEFADQKNKVGFSASPMIGAHIPLGQRLPVKLNVGVKYNYTAFSYNELKNINTVEANIGLSILLR